ncbi:aminotransferase class V-fold PLP-dependent enzyme [Sneathiella marina]|uniref:Aminotransferase class V-fold PLP-dependent enzyme n=1 Tax=Sneathiella marina TaxID=2950108 RepID=A0ABY4WAC9_9PROT|nr:aminotransferase class V-fold PLP-dependent enzyme [Sneathiella marina]USG62710.1 aminotransferase class V-fold PLP-dependent enzyme [Sneathiella marina]
MIPCQRHLFDIPESITYFNCGYMSPQLKSVRTAGYYGVDRKSSPWEMTPTDFFTLPDQARSLFGQMVNADASSIAIIPSASYGLAIAAKNIAVSAGQKILVLQDQFPSNVYCWNELSARTGAEVVTIKTPADFDWTTAVLAAIDDDTAIAALGHIHWTDGSLLDLEAIGDKLRAHGAKLVLDITQSIGALPFDVAKIQPDFMIAATYKWMLGPYSLGFMYVAPEHHSGEPLEYNWLNRGGSENFSGLVDYRNDYQEGALRFDMGERANFSLMPMAIAALEQLLEWGVTNIQETLSLRTRAIAERCSELGMQAIPEPLRAGHFLGLRHRDGLPANLLETLVAENIYISVRGASLRITPHLFNTDQDADRLVLALSDALKRR